LTHRTDQHTILTVDDDEVILEVLQGILAREGYQVVQARNGEEALQQVQEELPDLILLDLRMPGMGGLEALQRLKADRLTRLTPVIVLTAYDQEKVQALRLGADDFLAKPFEREELLARMEAHLRWLDAIRNLDDAESILVSIAKLVEARDAYTEEHVERVARTALRLGEGVGVSGGDLDALRRGALLHDIGKVGISEMILNKPGPLTDEERAEMQRHVLIGEEVCRPLRTLRGALPIIRHHHERWDGRGYPDGLAGEDIPLLARIVAVADVFDALASDRPYRPAWPEEKARAYIQEQAGQQFDPQVVEVFVELRIWRG